ncbi:HET-domain-containing protein, partial [Acephala macrosclerotiorum]
EIRLLHLLPGDSSEPVHVVLEAVPFTSDNVPDFEALSYCWGSEENPMVIFVGESDEFTLAVTRNLGEALSYLRFENASRVLWIDAICVNQQDLDERSRQVKRMADIYSNAGRVIVWLGPESEDSDIAIDCIEEVASHVEVNWSIYAMHSKTDSTHWADGNVPAPFDTHEYLALSNFLGRNWFERLWIWQEVLLSSHDPVVVCGNRSLAWDAIRSAMLCLIRKPLPPHTSYEDDKVFRSNLHKVYAICSGNRAQPFNALINQTRHCECSDPRDRVFALLSLVHPWWDVSKLELSYTKDVFEVYQEAMLFWSRKARSLSLLPTVEMRAERQKGPSWVPDWSVRRTTWYLPLCLAGGRSVAVIPHDAGKVLPLTGIIVGEIGVVEKFDFPDAEMHQLETTARELCKVLSRSGITGPFIRGSKPVRDLCVVLMVGNFAEDYYPPDNNCPTLEETERALCHVLDHEYASTRTLRHSADATNLLEGALMSLKTFNFVLKYGLHRSLFKSTEGHLGLGPAEAQPGDIIAVLLGCHSAMILRLVEDNKYKVVGEAFCQGFSNGEGLLGPLP